MNVNSQLHNLRQTLHLISIG